MKKIILSILSISVLFSINSCKKDKVPGNGPVTLHFDSRAGNNDLNFSNEYVTAFGDTVKFTTFNYFISNVVLIKADGSEYVVPKDSCYHLVKESDVTTHDLTITNVPGGDYTGVKFTIGVDSLKSASDISQRTGDLDVAGAATDMYWIWNSGYIFYKIEGTSPSAPFDPMMGAAMFFYHIGGFGGYSSATINNLKTVTLTYSGTPGSVDVDKNPEFHIYADALEVFKTPNTLSISANPGVMFAPFSTTIADNYSDMFSIDHIHN